MKENMDALIGDFKNLKVLVVGDAILDTYTKGTTDSISREAPVLVLNVQERQHRCGGAANTAINVAALGAETYFLTVLGRDANAREIVTILRKNKVHSEYIITDKARTTIAKQRIVASSNILLRTDEGSLCDITATYKKNLLERFAALYPQMDAVIFSDYGYGVLTKPVIDAIKAIVHASSKPLVVDAKDVGKYRVLHPTAVKPNFTETLKLLGIKNMEPGNRIGQLLSMEGRILSLSGAQNAVVTLDTDGVLLFEKGKQPYHIPCVPRDNTKSIGAGDTFTSALTLALALKTDGQTAANIASAAAGVVVQKNGTAVCSNTELMACFTSATKFTSVKQLVNIVKELKKQQRKIVFTNGCFDILHKGHIALLNQAREAGDVLIVGVNSDKSIRALKGPGRPINSLDDRITVLAGLHPVDYLVSFDEVSSDHLIQALRPDVFVKGGNYTPHNIREMPLLKKMGCEIKIVPYIEDHSTRYIIDKIKHMQDELIG
jgi:D-beta-D-heptose 7-phosphate kinase/D-beta-D-heptose 1-phosphate adenosyltransferase